jgi:hypothetical protein
MHVILAAVSENVKIKIQSHESKFDHLPAWISPRDMDRIFHRMKSLRSFQERLI